jgi:hypothetical protein
MPRIFSSFIMTDSGELRKSVLIALSVLFSITLVPLASAHLPGRMTGGGSIQCGDFGKVTHGFELHCIFPEGSAADVPNNLEINWGGGNNFHLTILQTAVCTDQGDEGNPEAGFNTMVATGTGLLNGAAGATIEFTLIDNGEPGAGADIARYLIRDASNTVVLNCPLTVLDEGGNHQAHKVNP